MNSERKWTLTESEVLERVSSYESTATTDTLLGFGRILIDANRDRTKQLETKATLIVGYCIALVAFVVTRPVTTPGWASGAMMAATILAIGGLVAATWALLVKTHPWLSDSQWFENSKGVLDDTDRLKRCHVLALHSVNARLHTSNDTKADRIMIAQWLTVLAGIALALSLWLR